MSNGSDYFGDYFGGTPGTPGTSAGAPAGNPYQAASAAAPQTDRFGLPAAPSVGGTQSGYAPGYQLGASMWQPPAAQPPSRRNRAPLVVASIVVVAAAVAASVFFFTRSSNSVPMPASVAGLPRMTNLPSSIKTQMKQVEHQLESQHLRDATARVYGENSANQAMVVVAARSDHKVADMAQVSALFDSEVSRLGTGTTSGLVTSRSTDFECMWQRTNNPPIALCFWWGGNSVLYGNAIGLDVQSAADALADVKAFAALN